MTAKKPPPTQIDKSVAAGLFLAVAVSIGALHWGAGPDRQVLGLAISPFGWKRLIVIQALATLMLSWWSARMLAQWKPAWKAPRTALLWGAAGLAIAGWTVVSGTAVGRIIDSGRADYVSRLFVRILWCVALQTPWCMLGLAVTTPTAGRRPLFSAVNLCGLAWITAVGVPISFLFIFLDQQTKYAQDAWQRMRLVESQLIVQRLYDVGSTAHLGERTRSVGPRAVTVEVTPAMALSDLQDARRFVEQQIDEIVNSPDPDHLRLAQYYSALNRTAEAEVALTQIADREPAAALELARLRKEQGQLAASREWAEKALRLAQQAGSDSSAEAEARDAMQQMAAYDMLVVLAGEEADFKTAERHLLAALQQLPAHAASIHGRLAKHYEFTGEIANARKHQQAAAEAAPDEFSPPESMLAKMLSSGAPVGLARPKSSRYK